MEKIIIIMFMFFIGGCSTVAGVGKDVTDEAATIEREIEFFEQKIISIEAQINIEVYKLYDINPEEVAIIEQT